MKCELVPGSRLRLNFLDTLTTIYGVIKIKDAEDIFRAFYNEELYDNETLRLMKDKTTRTIEDMLEDKDVEGSFIASDDNSKGYVESTFSFIEMEGDEYICNYMLADPTLIYWVLYVQERYDRYDAVKSNCPLFDKSLLMNEGVYDYPINYFNELKQYLIENYNCDNETAILLARTSYFTQRSVPFPIFIEHVFDDIDIQFEQYGLDLDKATKDFQLAFLITQVFVNTRTWVYNGHTLNEIKDM